MHKLLLATLLSAGLLSGASVGGKLSPDGKEIDVDLPDSQQLKNIGGSDGSGLCVFTSIGHAARWQRVEALEEFQAWMKAYPGGGYPEKVTKKISEISKVKGLPEPRYIQVEGGKEMLDVIKAALKSGRMVSCTYSFSPSGRYGGQKISHMVNCVYMSDTHACILDNNFPGTSALEWITIDEFLRTFTGGGRSGWAVILLDSGPPSLPWN